MGRAVVQSQLTFFVRSCRSDESDPFGARPLTRQETNAPRSRMKQNSIPCLEGHCPVEEVFHGHTLQHHRGTFLKRHFIRQWADLCSRHHPCLGIGAGRVRGIGGAISNFQVRDALANSLDHARCFHAHRVRQLHRVEANPLIDVNKVKSNGLMLDADFAFCRRADLEVHQVELLGATVLVDHCCKRHIRSPVSTGMKPLIPICSMFIFGYVGPKRFPF